MQLEAVAARLEADRGALALEVAPFFDATTQPLYI
jgi:hypothetical protein